jgi:GNAT superfamily N-acetyltransferase
VDSPERDLVRATIRKAQPEDLERIVEMAARFVSETDYGKFVKVNPDRLSRTVVDLVTNPNGVVFIAEDAGRAHGMIAAIMYEHPYSGELTSFEIAWWVDPESRGCGLRLLNEAEDWARSGGAKAMQMVAPTERVGELYKTLGYAPVETSFQRSL